MHTGKEKPELILLGNTFLIDSNLNEISAIVSGRAGMPMKIEPKVMRVLRALVDHNNRLVTKEQLVQEIWEGYGGAEEALMQAISKLRKTFNDSVKNSKVIETIPKQGYRLLMSAKVITDHKYLPNDYSEAVQGSRDGFMMRFWDRMVQPRYFIVFIISALLLMGILGILSQIIFWS